MDYFLIFSEGYHDQALVQKILEFQFHFRKFSGAKGQLDPFWHPLIPSYPPGGNFYRRTPFPSICSSSRASVAICVVEGDNIEQKISETCQSLKEASGNPFQKLKGCALVGDAEEKSAQEKFATYKAKLSVHLANLPERPGQISTSAAYQGIYLFPDNTSSGTLEIVLLACAGIVYADLKNGAENYISHIPAQQKTHWDRLKRDEKKALVGCITNILKPGKTNQASIADDDWVSQATLTVPEIASLLQFFHDLFHF